MNSKKKALSADRLMTLEEVREELRVGRVTALRLIWCRKLPGFKVGRAWRIRRKDLERFTRPQIVMGQGKARQLDSLAPGPKILGKGGIA